MKSGMREEVQTVPVKDCLNPEIGDENEHQTTLGE